MHGHSPADAGDTFSIMVKSASGGTMIPRLSSLLILSALLVPAAHGKDKKPAFTEDILRAQTVLVMVDPDAGEPLDQPSANAMARESVEKALMEWGRFRLVLDGEQSDLIIAIRTGSGRMVRPTIKGGAVDRRPGVGQSTDSSIRIGGQHGQPPMRDPTMDPQVRARASATKLALPRTCLPSTAEAPAARSTRHQCGVISGRTACGQLPRCPR